MWLIRVLCGLFRHSWYDSVLELLEDNDDHYHSNLWGCFIFSIILIVLGLLISL